MTSTAAILLIAATLALVGDEQGAKKYQEVTFPTPATAAALCVADLSELPAEDWAFQRYFWVPDRDQGTFASLAFAFNAAVSRVGVPVRPVITGGGQLARIDLRMLAPNGNDFAQLKSIWIQLAADDPYFHVREIVVDRRGNRAAINRPAPHLGNAGSELLRMTTPDQDGIARGILLRADWFVVKALTTVDGGKYYDLIGIEEKPAKQTAFAAYLQRLGTSEALVAALESDERAAIERSKVTGKPRRVDMIRSLRVKPTRGTGLVAITHDPRDGDINAAADPIRNLLEFKDAGREVIAERSNGWHEFTLFDAQGNLAKSVPDDIASDHLQPAPHTRRLQPALSCIRCHGPEEGWQPVDNVVHRLLQSNADRLDVFDDLASRQGVNATVQRLAGLYSGDMAEPLRLGRNSYSTAVFLVTGGKSVQEASKAIADLYRKYDLDEVTPQVAARDLGFAVDEATAAIVLRAALSRLPAGADEVSPEDPILGLLKSGTAINRRQWEAVYADAMTRASAAVIWGE